MCGMRCALVLLAAVASAQQSDPRGFVNERLLRQNVARLATKAMTPPVLRYVPAPEPCAIPLMPVAPAQKDADPKMILPQPGGSIDEKMTRPTMPPCPAR